MSELYNTTILQLAKSIPNVQSLVVPQGSSEKRSPICGSRVRVDVELDRDGRVAVFGQVVRACILGQASAALMGAHLVGRSLSEIEQARDTLADFLKRKREDAGSWPGLEVFVPAKDYVGRHPSIKLPFEAAAAAVQEALLRRMADGSTGPIQDVQS